jgi:ribosome maturation factor RimP
LRQSRQAARPGTTGVAAAVAIVDWHGAVERTVAGLGYDLVDLERSARGLLRVTIDRVPGRRYAAADGAPAGEGGFVTVDDCEAVTRQLQYALEVEGVDYQRLEVSSPGLDRVLKRPADFTRFAGEAVDLTLKAPFQGRRHWRGVLAAREGGWRLALDGSAGGTPGHVLDFALDEVREARLVPVFDFRGRGRQATPAEDMRKGQKNR